MAATTLSIRQNGYLCLPQIKPEHIGNAVYLGSDGTENASSCLGADYISASMFDALAIIVVRVG